jgi:hypothetical protein
MSAEARQADSITVFDTVLNFMHNFIMHVKNAIRALHECQWERTFQGFGSAEDVGVGLSICRVKVS